MMGFIIFPTALEIFSISVVTVLEEMSIFIGKLSIATVAIHLN